MILNLHVNAQEHSAPVEPRTHLADFLRDELLLTGTHLGCEHGVCGACTLMLDGRPVRSCLTLAATCAGADVRTIEGFEDDALMQALRLAFSRHHALQCGYCTPGMLVSAYDIVRRLPKLDEARIRTELAGNLCRCTGYAGIVSAIAEVAAAGIVAPLQPSARTPTTAASAIPRSPSTPLAKTERIPSPRNWDDQDLAGATTISRSLPLTIPLEQAWRLLRDPERVVGCVPGATLTQRDGDELEGNLVVTIGPMRATFQGAGCLTTDDAARSGSLRGGADDPVSRSSAAGRLDFRLEPMAEGCRVHADIRYRLVGPLAQVGRPAIVADVMDRMLARFGTNLVAAASGTATDVKPLSGLAMMVSLLAAAIRRVVRRALP